MKQHRDMIISSQALDSRALARYVENFAEQSADWQFPSEKSSLYEQACRKPSCCVIATTDSLPHAAVHLTEKTSSSLYVTNVVPLSRSQLSMDECNSVLVTLSRKLRAHAHRGEESIVVKLSKPEIYLSDIVPGKVTKQFLDRYLSQYPLSSHPLDIQRLDNFICALFRYKRKSFNLDAFEALLMEECGWSSKDARWCRSRVETGLQVLAANRNF